MAAFPYAQSLDALSQVVSRLRKSFPEKVDASYLKQLGLAPNNESYIVNTLRFIGVVNKESMRTEAAHDLFVKSDEEFSAGFARIVKDAYQGLFDLYADDAWLQGSAKLVNFFRAKDKSSEGVGARQAKTFMKLAEISGMRPVQQAPGNGAGSKSNNSTPRQKKRTEPKADGPIRGQDAPPAMGPAEAISNPAWGTPVSLAVKIEVNLPATSDQSVYDAIFKSIRGNLIDRD